MSRATDDALDGLHAEVAKVILAGLKGETPSPQLIAQAIKFLKDNGIDAPASSPRISSLQKALDELEPTDDELRAGLN